MWVWGQGVVRDGVSHLGAVLIGWEGDIQLSVGVQTPRVGVWGGGTWAPWGVKKVSEFWRVVSGIQQLVARDGGSAGCGGGGGGGTDLNAVLGPGGGEGSGPTWW